MIFTRKFWYGFSYFLIFLIFFAFVMLAPYIDRILR